MSMTENEAIKRLQTLNIILTDKAGHKEDGFEKIFTFSDITAICTAIQALEKQVPEKPIEKKTDEKILYICPCCGKVFIEAYDTFQRGYIPKFCEVCGQAID